METKTAKQNWVAFIKSGSLESSSYEMFRKWVYVPLDITANDFGGTNHLLNDSHKDFADTL